MIRILSFTSFTIRIKNKSILWKDLFQEYWEIFFDNYLWKSRLIFWFMFLIALSSELDQKMFFTRLTRFWPIWYSLLSYFFPRKVLASSVFCKNFWGIWKTWVHPETKRTDSYWTYACDIIVTLWSQILPHNLLMMILLLISGNKTHFYCQLLKTFQLHFFSVSQPQGISSNYYWSRTQNKVLFSNKFTKFQIFTLAWHSKVAII